MLRHTNEKRVGLMALMIVFMGGYFQETGTSPYDLRRLVIDDGPTVLDGIVEQRDRAGRGRAEAMTPRVRNVAFDLFRHEALMRLGPVPRRDPGRDRRRDLPAARPRRMTKTFQVTR